MGIKAFNHGDDFVNKFIRAIVSDSTGTDAVSSNVAPQFGAPQGLTATGGIISDYVSTPGNVYRAHVFTSSGTFAVSALSGSFPAAVEYLVVAGGGGGGVGGDFSSYQSGGGGGGAGGLLVSPSFPGVPTSQNQGTGMTVSAGPTTYTITIGAGGLSGVAAPTVGTAKGGLQGADSVISGPDITTITANGGGGGSGNSRVAQGGSGYGSGGGGEGAYAPGPLRAVGAGGNYPGPSQQGFPGGLGSDTSGPYANTSRRSAGGGGGAGGVGNHGGPQSPDAIEGIGGIGLQVLIAGNAPAAAIGTPGPSGTGWVAQGGVGGRYNNGSNASLPQPAGGGGGAGGGHSTAGTDGLSGTGGGGGGANAPGPGSGLAGAGGSGIVVVRYQIGRVTALAKATGGDISFYNNKTIHAFTTTGDFNNTSGANLTGCEVVILGGGGGGGCWQGGAGGSGRFYRNDDVTLAPGPNAVTIGAGGRGGTAIGEGGDVGSTGTPSVFNSVTMPAGGGGAKYNANATAGGSGGGGAGGPGSYGPAPAGAVVAVTNVDTPAVGAGNAGANGQTAGPHGAGGGGGVGGTATAGSSGNGGPGGLGVQLPSTFRNPITSIGYLSNGVNHFVGGGGGGGAGPPSGRLAGGGGGAPTVPGPKQAADGSMPVADQATYMWAGAGSGMADKSPVIMTQSALANSGSGGGGNGSGYPSSGQFGGNGGSGIVLIAYTST